MEMNETFEVRVYILEDGREFITDRDAAERPEIADFVARYPNYWTRDERLFGWIGPADG